MMLCFGGFDSHIQNGRRQISLRTGNTIKRSLELPERRILVVENEKVLADALEDYFVRLDPRFIVLSANSVPAAIKVVRNFPIDLVVANHEGSGKFDGLDLLLKTRELGVTVHVALIAEKHLEADRRKALSMGCSNFVTKPYPAEQLCELLFNMLQPQQGFIGRLVGMRLEDVIQMFCYRKDSTMLSVTNGEMLGAIYVHDGGIIHAECDSMIGVEAFYEILGWDSGEFLSQIALTVPEKTVFMDWQSLLMEGMRQKDEIRHALEPPIDTPSGNGMTRTAARESAPDSEPVKRIMIVDDSRFIRKIVREILQSDSGIAVAGYATNGQEALAKLEELKPDLVLLDWDMPVMKGSTTLMHIMIRSPCPVIILSGFVGGVGANPFDLLCLGGVDFLRKPQNNWRMDGRADDLVHRIKEACRIKFDRIRRVKIPPPMNHAAGPPGHTVPSSFLSVLGSSTGGCSDLIRIVPMLPEDLPSAVVILHDMQQEAIGAFIDYLDRRSRIRVKPLESGAPLMDGVCYVHPATVPLELAKEGNGPVLKTFSKLPGLNVLDHFLISASKIMGKNILAILLSGGPDKGITGLRAVKQVEGITMVQDPGSSIDPRMAESALQEGVVDHRCSADALIDTFLNLIR
jgi:two-component system, chemotaxis family, protein-glutamate methylesterase/glutaminase